MMEFAFKRDSFKAPRAFAPHQNLFQSLYEDYPNPD
jgi:hypothetical protein